MLDDQLRLGLACMQRAPVLFRLWECSCLLCAMTYGTLPRFTRYGARVFEQAGLFWSITMQRQVITGYYSQQLCTTTERLILPTHTISYPGCMLMVKAL